jgi:hypothetical protein
VGAVTRTQIALAALLCAWLPSAAWAQEEAGAGDQADGARAQAAAQAPRPAARPTIQRRFAPKTRLAYAHAIGIGHVRDDFYHSWGGGVDAGYFFNEWLGAELRVAYLYTVPNAAAVDLQQRIGLVPDARPQDLWLKVGARWAPAYGKFLIWDAFVVHVDPQIAVHLGAARADTRWMPSATAALSVLLHFQYGIKAKIDLGSSFQLEPRERGWTFSTGFTPAVGVGWGRTFE